jgi:CRISPR/Cas system-associated exonuclease Cas4 (RecB family)
MFEHADWKLNYKDLEATTGEKERTYETPEGNKYPSVTTVLSILSEDSIRAWRKRVGEAEANKISHQASTRGTAVHAIIEKYIDNVEDFTEGYMPNVVDTFRSVQNVLDTYIGKVYAQEVALYSDHLQLAGRVDCVAEWNGQLSIIDFKTSRRLKKKENIEGYFIQEAAYAIMWEERTGIPITQLVTLIAVDGEYPQVFIERRDNHTEKLLSTIKEYQRRKLFGR